MFIPNTFGMLSRHLGRNEFSEFLYAAPVKTPCAVIDFQAELAKTSVRVDQSGSRGNIEEDTIVAMLLFTSKVKLVPNDRFEIMGYQLRVRGVQPRLSTLGKLDHYEVTMAIDT